MVVPPLFVLWAFIVGQGAAGAELGANSIHTYPDAQMWMGDSAPANCKVCHGERAKSRPGARRTGIAVPMFDRVVVDPVGQGLNPESATCVACHDGVLASATTAANTHSTTGILNINGNHPVSVSISSLSRRRSDLRSRQEIIDLGIPLFGEFEDQVECRSCHTAHNIGTPALLRIDNQGSRLCLACHRK